MNLHAIAAPLIGIVNPFIDVRVQVSDGYTTNQDGKQVPRYKNPQTVEAQVQPLTFKDLTQIEGLNLNGTRRAIYLRGKVDGLVRPDGKGGDLITLPDGAIYLVALVLEQWPDWCKVAVTLQNQTALYA